MKNLGEININQINDFNFTDLEHETKTTSCENKH